MHAVVRRNLWFASKQPARIISGRRYSPRIHRSLHITPSNSLDIFPHKSDTTYEGRGGDETPPISQTNNLTETIPPEVADEADTSSTQGVEPSRDQNAIFYGSGKRRSMRNRRHREGPEIVPVTLSADFLSNNIRLYEIDESLVRGDLHISGSDPRQDEERKRQKSGGGPSDEPELPEESEVYEMEPSGRSETPQYSVNQALMSEVLASMSAGLMLHEPGDARLFNSHSFAKHKAHLKLLCPVDGGIYFLDKIVEEAATKLGADIVSLDPQSVAEMAVNYIDESPKATSNALWTLGYDTAHVFNHRVPRFPPEEDAGEEDGLEEEEGDKESTLGMSPRVQSTVIPLSQAPAQLQDAIKNWFTSNPVLGNGPKGGSIGGRGTGIFPMLGPHGPGPEEHDIKLRSMLEAMLGSNEHKHQMIQSQEKQHETSVEEIEKPAKIANETTSPAEGTTSSTDGSAPEMIRTKVPMDTRSTVVVVKDFKEMRNTPQGNKVIEQLIKIVQKRRQSGQPIMIVGITATADLAQSAMNMVEDLQGEDDNTVFRTIVITPDTDRGLYSREVGKRIREINGRHIYAMIKRLDPQATRLEDIQAPRHFAQHLHDALATAGTDKALILEDRIMSLDEVHRIVFTALGQRTFGSNTNTQQPLSSEQIIAALDLIEQSDKVKTQWVQDEHQTQTPFEAPPSTSRTKESAAFDTRIKKMRKTCNQHEKNLLRGVVNPDAIRTAFADVHAAPETIDALKTLTTLSLTRPEAFKYGVLAKDKINGLLLYGPPGTGKTLLAKAVAKESGATMLEVSGSDVYDMYVGEGEKNVRAVFSLAKKLAPCVVFIDEADAIFASRGSGTNRNSHRELINQFLREWDGMNETNAFIMVATNRPFDLDDAALRRLPRRLLVDLPTEKDREAILQIHLKDEMLAQDVSLSKLASQTPLYSGSDLKNLAVAAALAAVKEENEDKIRHDAQQHQQSQVSNLSAEVAEATHADTSSTIPPMSTEKSDYVFPTIRTLKLSHFEKALEEISASVSEDMSSLGAIRKFDEKYGDRRGRRKKMSYGFTPIGGVGGDVEGQRLTESGRVRN